MLCSGCGKLDKEHVIRVEGNLIRILCRKCQRQIVLQYLTETYHVTVAEHVTLLAEGMDYEEIEDFLKSDSCNAVICSNCEYGHCKDSSDLAEEINEQLQSANPHYVLHTECGHAMEDIATLQSAYGDGAARYCEEFLPYEAGKCVQCGKRIPGDVVSWNTWVTAGDEKLPCCSERCSEKYIRENE